MAVTYYAPLAKPTINSLTAIAGTIPAGTYDVRIVSRGQSGDLRSVPLWCSPASDAVQIVLAATGGIQIALTAPDANHNNTLVYIKLSSATYYSLFNANYVGYAGTSIDLTSYTAIFYMLYLTEDCPEMPYGLSKVLGSGKLTISGAAGNLTIANLAAAMVAAGETNFLYSSLSLFACVCPIEVTASSGTLSFTEKTLSPFYGYFGNANFSLTCAGGGSTINGKLTIAAYMEGGCTFARLSKCDIKYAELGQGCGATGRIGGFILTLTADSLLTFCHIHLLRSSYLSTNYVTCTFFGESIIASGNITDQNLFGIVFFSYNWSEYTIAGGISDGSGNYDFIMNNNNVYSNTAKLVRNRTFLNRSLNLPVCYWSNNGNLQNDLLIQRSFDLIAYDAVTQAVLSGVTVTITRSDAVVVTLTTDVNGAVTQTWLTHARFNKLAGSGAGYGDAYTDKTIYSYTMTLAKTGYQSETIPLTITDKIVLSVGLKPQTGGGGIINSGFIKGI